jgi:hypothetical protein
MKAADWLSQHRKDIVRQWIRRTMAAYPAASRAVFERNRNQFANPLPHILSTGIERLFDALTDGAGPDEVALAMDGIVRLKAVQDFAPSQALSFVFELKAIIKEQLGSELNSPEVFNAFLVMEQDIDRMASIAFDLYTACREKLFEIRTNEIRNQTHMLIRRVNEMDKQNEAR